MAAEPSASKKKKGSKGLPPGILEHRSGKLQARLLGIKVDGKAYQRPIPGLFKDDVEAMAAQAASKLLFESGGIEAVWPPKESAPDERNKRGQVRRPAACSCSTLPVLCVLAPPNSLLVCTCRAQRDDSSLKHALKRRPRSRRASHTSPKASGAVRMRKVRMESSCVMVSSATRSCPPVCLCRVPSKTSPMLACAPCGRLTARLRRSLLIEGSTWARMHAGTGTALLCSLQYMLVTMSHVYMAHALWYSALYCDGLMH